MLFYFYFKNSFMKTMATLGRVSGSLLDTLRTGELPAEFGVAAPAEEFPAPGEAAEVTPEDQVDDAPEA